jgi:alpha-beta hydrolase superfamily lysophospholipase
MPAPDVQGTVDTRDGVRLFWRGWQPARPRAVLLIVHGLAEHSGRYGPTAGYFVDREFAVFAFDQRGHGRSPGRRVHVGSFDEFWWDLEAMLGEARGRVPGVPVFLLGHSQGGLVVLDYVLRHPADLAGAVVTSPLLGVHPAQRASPALTLLARVLSRVWPSVLIPNRIDPKRLSRDPAVGVAYVADPLVSHAVSPRWFTSAQQAMARVREGAQHLAVPTLLLAAGNDRVVDPEASRRFAEHAPPGMVEFVTWDALRHEILNEPERAEVWARIGDWMRTRPLPA